MTTTQLRVTGMVCDACVGHVKKALQEVEGVQAVEVDREAGRASAEHAGVDHRELIAAVAEAGYEAEVASDTA